MLKAMLVVESNMGVDKIENNKEKITYYFNAFFIIRNGDWNVFS